MLTTGANSGIGLATVLHPAGPWLSFGRLRPIAGQGGACGEAAASAAVTVEAVVLDVDDAERGRNVVDWLRPWALVQRQ